jgi:ribonucleotide monophosphatase NagD (HAD superfamily)
MLLGAIKAGTGAVPRAVAGKPNRWIVAVARKHFNIKAGEIVIVGDRLQTDMRMARKFRMKSVLVLSGVTRAWEVKKSRIKPDVVVGSVSELTNKYWFGKLGWL